MRPAESDSIVKENLVDLLVVYAHFFGQKIVEEGSWGSGCLEITLVAFFDAKPLFFGHIRDLSEESLAIMEEIEISKDLPGAEPRGFGQDTSDLGEISPFGQQPKVGLLDLETDLTGDLRDLGLSGLPLPDEAGYFLKGDAQFPSNGLSSSIWRPLKAFHIGHVTGDDLPLQRLGNGSPLPLLRQDPGDHALLDSKFLRQGGVDTAEGEVLLPHSEGLVAFQDHLAKLGGWIPLFPKLQRLLRAFDTGMGDRVGMFFLRSLLLLQASWTVSSLPVRSEIGLSAP
jgi:hypothetical protein